MGSRMLPSMYQYFENEQDIGVWYMLYENLRNDLNYAKDKMKLLDTYR